MINKYNKILAPIFILSDIILMMIIFVIIYLLQFDDSLLKNLNYLLLLGIQSLIWLCFSIYFKLFKEGRLYHHSRELKDFIYSEILFLCVLFIYIIFTKSNDYSRLFLIKFCVAQITGLFISHELRRIFVGHIRSQGYNSRSIYVVGTKILCNKVTSWIQSNSTLGFGYFI